jgi:hypothetical protein
MIQEVLELASMAARDTAARQRWSIGRIIEESLELRGMAIV